MRNFYLNKLVRDKVFLSMQELGQRVKFRRLTDAQYLSALQEKLLEEAKEFDPKDPKAIDELADVLEVVEAIGEIMGIDFQALRRTQAKRRDKSGSFDKRIYVEQLGLDDDDPWVKYYANDPDRFPERKV